MNPDTTPTAAPAAPIEVTDVTAEFAALTDENPRKVLLGSRLELMIRVIRDKIDAYWRENGYTHQRPEVDYEYISRLWVRVFTFDKDNSGKVLSRNCYGFVAIADNTTRTLGAVKTGDIHKSDSWKKPAKKARGNVLRADFPNCLGWSGVAYLR